MLRRAPGPDSDLLAHEAPPPREPPPGVSEAPRLPRTLSVLGRRRQGRVSSEDEPRTASSCATVDQRPARQPGAAQDAGSSPQPLPEAPGKASRWGVPPPPRGTWPSSWRRLPQPARRGPPDPERPARGEQ